MSETEVRSDITALTVELLSAYLTNNTVASGELASLIRATKTALTYELDPPSAPPEEEAHAPAVSARKSVSSPDHILSLIDGKPYKTLKRHLARHGLTPDTYRERYQLPSSYPMVAPSFAAKRREIARHIGLGLNRKSPPAKGQAAAQEHSVAVEMSESDSVKASAEKKTAGTTKARVTSRTQPGSKSRSAKASMVETPKAEFAAEGLPAKRSASAAKIAAPDTASPQKSGKQTSDVKPAAVANNVLPTELRPKQVGLVKANSYGGANAVSAEPKPLVRGRRKSALSENATPESAAVEATKLASRAKLGLFRGEATKPGRDVAKQPVVSGASENAGGSRQARKAKRMARGPDANAQG